jgi:hypothetical protein
VWNDLIRYNINHDGSWELTSAAICRETQRDLNDAWADNFVSGTGSSACGKKHQLQFATCMAWCVIDERWDAQDDPLWAWSKGCRWGIETA